MKWYYIVGLAGLAFLVYRFYEVKKWEAELAAAPRQDIVGSIIGRVATGDKSYIAYK